MPLSAVLVENSRYDRGKLKARLYAESLKERVCELCGQGELWNGRPISLILDHVNGVADDNRLDNLRIVCPNCNATLETHCGRNAHAPHREVECAGCGRAFRPRRSGQRYCSRYCGTRARQAGPRLTIRRAERPRYFDLVAMIEAEGYAAVGRRFGVSGTAIRKWRLAFERELSDAVEGAARRARRDFPRAG